MALCAVSVLVSPAGCRAEFDDDPVTLAGAASLRTVVPELLEAYRATRTDAPPISVTYGASGTLRRQVEGGAPIAGVLFAGHGAVDALIDKGLADPKTRRRVATNELVLIAPKAAGPAAALTFETLDTIAADAKLAIGDPEFVPAGTYARDALTRLDIWDALRDRLVFGGDVAMVLTYVRHAEVSAAIVYATELHGIDDVQVLDRARGAWAPRPEVVVAVTSEGPDGRSAAAFFDFVASPAGLAILERHGFGPP